MVLVQVSGVPCRAATESQIHPLTLILKLLDIQNRNLNSLLGQQVNHNLSDSVAASRHDDDLLVPIVRVLAPVVRHCIVEVGASAAEETPRDQRLQIFISCGMFCGEYIALRCVARDEEEGNCEGRIERRQLEEAANCIARDAYAVG